MNRPRLRVTRPVIVAGAVTLMLAAGTTVATAAVMSSASPVSGSGVIDGCWTNAEINGSHVIVLQDQGTSCPKGTTAISWNPVRPDGTGWSGRPDRTRRDCGTGWSGRPDRTRRDCGTGWSGRPDRTRRAGDLLAGPAKRAFL